MSATDVEPRATIDWYWRPTNQVRAILEALAEAGVLGIARRDGNRRVYDLAERLFPAELLAERPPPDEQQRHRLLSRYRAHGLLGTGGQAELWFGTTRRATERAVRRAELVASGALIEVAVEGLRGPRYLPSDALATLDAAEAEVRDGVPPGRAEPGVAFLAALDPFVWDRALLRDLFGFDYVWEVYVPQAKRRWGYYVLPILFGDRLVGRIEPRIERRERRAPGRRAVVRGRLRPAGRAGVRSGLRRRPPRTRRVRRRRTDRAAPECTTPPRGRGGVEAARAGWTGQRLTRVRCRR